MAKRKINLIIAKARLSLPIVAYGAAVGLRSSHHGWQQSLATTVTFAEVEQPLATVIAF
uniref:Uncharacterized protein ORF02 n=1 Tax=Citrus unshiu TaxID=55188 RepID=F8WL69_CITUN|nr:hypothetical protein [Citrus unshiu]